MVHSGTSLGAVKAGLSQGPPEGLCIGFVFMMHGLFTICVLISVKQTCNACDLINCFDFVLNAPLRTCLKIFLSGAKKRNAFVFLFFVFFNAFFIDCFDLVVFAAYGLVSGRGRNSSVGKESATAQC